MFIKEVFKRSFGLRALLINMCLMIISMLSADAQFINSNIEKVCVLSFERSIHPFTKELERIFNDNKNIYLKKEAKPIDLFKCIAQNEYSEIIILAHSFDYQNGIFRSEQTLENQTQYKLGYYVKDSKEISRKKMEATRKYLEGKVRKLRSNYYKICNSVENDTDKLCTDALYKLKRHRKFLKKIRKLPLSWPTYESKIFLNRIFNKIYKKFEELETTQRGISLKSIKFVNCVSKEMFKSHPIFKNAIDDFNIELGISPKQNIMSFIKGRDVTTLDSAWLAESVQDEKNGFLVYLRLKTRGVYRYGEKIALRGKYKIKIKGLALGFANKWTHVYVDQKDISKMEINETRNVKTIQLDLSVAFWLNGEMQIGRKLHYKGMSEINSLGLSFGLYQQIEITRLDCGRLTGSHVAKV